MSKLQSFERWMLIILYTILVLGAEKLYNNWTEMPIEFRSLYASLLGTTTSIVVMRLIYTKTNENN